jgi:hypothetical protein
MRQNIEEAFCRFELYLRDELVLAVCATSAAMRIALDRHRDRDKAVSHFVREATASIDRLDSILQGLATATAAKPAQTRPECEAEMLRLSRAKVIDEIEYIIDRPIIGVGPLRWEKRGVECSEERHGFRGQLYSFDVDITRIRSLGPSRRRWELLIVSECWRNAEDEVMHTTKWLKLTSGDSADVKKWIASNREAGLRDAATAARSTTDSTDAEATREEDF